MHPPKRTRLSRADKEKEEVTSSNNTGKRKRSISKEDHGSGSRRSIKKTKDGRMVDNFCWKCHELGYDKICSSCPRVYHDNCLLKAGKFTEQDVCPECQLQSVDGTSPSADLTTEMMDKVLVCLIRRLLPATTSKSYGFESHSKGRFSKMNDKIPTNFPELMKWPEKKYKTCKFVDLGMLIETIKRGGSYSRTIEVFSDVQWIYHNCYKFFGAQSEITKSANKIVKAVKNEILDIEACYECYYRNYNEIELYDSDPFPLICKNPHTLLWVKLRGHPFWPSKCLKVFDGKAHIQFFGTHDKNTVDAVSCYLLSRDNPNPKYVGQKSYKSAILDLQFYIQNFARKHGPYPYANVKVPFYPDASWHWVKEKPQLPSPKQKGSRKSAHGRRAIINENEDTGAAFLPRIDMSSVRGISNEDALQYSYETETTTIYACKNADNSYSNVSVVTGRYPCVSLPRLHDSVFFQYQANSRINLTSPPVITSLHPYDESTPDVDEQVNIVEQASQGASVPSTSPVGVQTLSQSEHINTASGSSSNDNDNPANESVTTRISNNNSNADLDHVISYMGLNENDLKTMNPETLKIMREGGRFINDAGLMMSQYAKNYEWGLEIISSCNNKLKAIDCDFREVDRKNREIWKKIKSKPITAKIIMGNIRRARAEMIKDFEEENKILEAEVNNIENVLLFCSKEHENMVKHIKRIHENRQNKTAEADWLTIDQYNEKKAKVVSETLQQRNEHSKKELEIRSQVWCKRCLELGKIYCCWNTYYCTENCRIRDLSIHQPSCSRKKSFSGHSVMIEEITDSDMCEDSASNSVGPIIEEI